MSGPLSYFGRFLLDREPLALFDPDPSTGSVVDRTGNYTATLTNGASVTSDELVSGAPGAISLDGTNDHVTTTLETRRNLITNPSLETGTTGYFALGTNTIAASTDQAFAGSQSLKVTYQNTLFSSGRSISAILETNATYWMQARVYIPTDWNGGAISITDDGEFAGKTVVDATNQSTTTKGSWVWLRWKIATATDIEGNLYLQIASAPTAGKFFYVDAVSVEKSTAATCPAYFDGSGYVNDAGSWVASTGTVCGWLGTAHASASDKGVFANGTTRTFVAVIKRDATTDADTLWGSSASSSYPVARLGAGGTTLSVSADQSETETFASVAASTPTLVAVEIAEASNTVKVWVNGVAHGSNPATHSAQYAARQTFQIGAYGSGSDPFDGLIGPVAIFDRALTTAEHRMMQTIRSIGGPLAIRRRR